MTGFGKLPPVGMVIGKDNGGEFVVLGVAPVGSVQLAGMLRAERIPLAEGLAVFANYVAVEPNRCSFCGNREGEGVCVKLCHGVGGLEICNVCVGNCARICGLFDDDSIAGNRIQEGE